MTFVTNMFSGRVYTETKRTLTTQEGDLFIKSGDDWIGGNGEFIQKQGNDLVNIETGVRSSFGDPFYTKEM